MPEQLGDKFAACATLLLTGFVELFEEIEWKPNSDLLSGPGRPPRLIAALESAFDLAARHSQLASDLLDRSAFSSHFACLRGLCRHHLTLVVAPQPQLSLRTMPQKRLQVFALVLGSRPLLNPVEVSGPQRKNAGISGVPAPMSE